MPEGSIYDEINESGLDTVIQKLGQQAVKKLLDDEVRHTIYLMSIMAKHGGTSHKLRQQMRQLLNRLDEIDRPLDLSQPMKLGPHSPQVIQSFCTHPPQVSMLPCLDAWGNPRNVVEEAIQEVLAEQLKIEEGKQKQPEQEFQEEEIFETNETQPKQFQKIKMR